MKIIILIMISTHLLRAARRSFLKLCPRFSMNHIKDMRQENQRVKLEEELRTPNIGQTNRVYKPTYTIEFNREGEVLLYSANPLTTETIYLKYPYILYESFIPLCILNYIFNPLDLVWYWGSAGLYGCFALYIPRIWYFARFKYTPMKLFLLRGGRVLKIQSLNLLNENFVFWFQTRQVRPLTRDKLNFDDINDANFLTTEGQLNYDLEVEVKNFKYYGVNLNDQPLYFKSYGTVHHPQLFEAALKGYNVDTTDFVINTSDNVRHRQPYHNC